MQAILVSPNFLFRVELDPNPAAAPALRTLNEYELASRLSYFLWSSMPDDELFELAARNKLREQPRRQVPRMLRDPQVQGAGARILPASGCNCGTSIWFRPTNRKSSRLSTTSCGAAMRTESEMFFEAIVLHEDRSILDLLDADFTFLNERLARLYGIQGRAGQTTSVAYRSSRSSGSRRRLAFAAA